jgi:phytoene synthase
MLMPTPQTLALRRQQDLLACVDLMRGGSKSFFAASRLLPARMRAASIALYAFCRVADDLVDEAQARGDDVHESLAQLHRRLDRIYEDRPETFVEDRALAVVVHQYELPRGLLDALLDGFAWDAQQRSYHSIEDVHAYGARVAGSVGAMMCWIMGARSASTLARACELGVAMQLTNIARDVGEDARNGRLYLPRQWMQQAGIDPQAWLSQPCISPQLQGVIERLLQEADRLYQQATAGVAGLPRDCRAAILAARLIYAEIGHQLRRDGLNPVDHRAVVPRSRKLVLLSRAWLPWVPSASLAHQAPLAAIAYLVDVCVLAGARPAPVRVGRVQRRPVGQRVEWMIDLFERQQVLRRSAR